MNMKYIFVIGAILFFCSVSTQISAANPYNSAGVRAYNNSGPVGGEYMEHRGVVVPRTEGVKWTLRAAEQGDAAAQFNMALRYDSGRGVTQDSTESVKWLRKAAEQDFIKAQYNLGCMYSTGEGVTQDHAEAVKWLRKAAEQGYASAQKNLGANFGNGQGVPQSDVEAYVWSSIAATSGDEGAINNRELAANRLSPEELEMAQKRVTELNREIQQRIADT